MSEFETITATDPLVLVGCGKMGSALLKGWLARGLSPEAVWIVDPAPENVFAQFMDVSGFARDRVAASIEDIPADIRPSFVVLAVKPQIMDQAIAALVRFVDSACYVSIAAGKTIGYFEQALGVSAAVIRAMPNTPAAIGRGITVAVANENVRDNQRSICAAMMKAAGEFFWVEDENLIDAVTAVSGSGPAYVFYLTECLSAAGKAAGLPEDLAAALAHHTVSGAGALMDATDELPATLRRNVTSPKGTTEAALDVLMAKDGLAPLMRKAVSAAARRSKELSD